MQEYKKGRIIKQISNDYTVNVDGNLVVCKPRGKFRQLNISPIVGDYVFIDLENKYIVDIEKRRNELIRPRIANIDYAVVVTSVQIPEFSTNLLDKLLVTIEINNIEPIICITKMDLIDEEKKQTINKYIEYYRNIGYKVYLNTDIDIKEVFKDKLTVLAGQSGAGKSTLLNKLDKNLKLETNEVSVALGRGKHTTRHTEFIFVCGGYIADTPGFSSLTFEGVSNELIRDNFIEFNEYRDDCKYADCMHIDEEDCAIKEMVNKGIILKSRYENYLKFIRKG